MKRYVIGIDIGGTNFRIGAVTENQEVVDFFKIPVKEVFHSTDALKDLGDYLDMYLQREQIKEQVLAIAIGFPATINKARTVVLQAPNVSFMENLPVVEYLQERLHLPVFIERDVCMTLFYDKVKYHVPDEGITVGCYYGTGIGSAILINGQILLGKDGVAGELGHIKVPGSDEQCGCGNKGCMENLAGGKYLTRLCQDTFPDTRVENIFTEKKDHPLLKEYVERIAISVTTEINILNPDYVLVGGGVTNMKDFPLPYLEEKIREYTRKPYPEASLQLIFAEDDQEKSVLGAAAYGRDQWGRSNWS